MADVFFYLCFHTLMAACKSEPVEMSASLKLPSAELSIAFIERMSVNMNPFTAGGWSTRGSSGSQNPWGDNSPPSVFGALPSLPVSSLQSAIRPDCYTFRFTSFRTTILNCTVIGPHNDIAYRVTTAPVTPSCTIWEDKAGRTAAMVQWQSTTLEIQGVTPRRRVKDWLRLSQDRAGRIMDVGGVQYVWMPRDNFIVLYKVNSPAPNVLARIARAPAMVLLELTKEAVSENLVEPCLVATVLLLCGHNID